MRGFLRLGRTEAAPSGGLGTALGYLMEPQRGRALAELGGRLELLDLEHPDVIEFQV